MPHVFKSRDVCRQLGVNYPWLLNTVRDKLDPPPAKDSSGDYQWTQQDVERARQALATDLRRKENKQQREAAGAN